MGATKRIIPFTIIGEFQSKLDFWVIVVREIARTLIASSPIQIQTIFDQ